MQCWLGAVDLSGMILELVTIWCQREAETVQPFAVYCQCTSRSVISYLKVVIDSML